MAEEYLGGIDSGEVAGTGSEKVSEEAMAKVQEEARQAKKVAQQLQQSKQENTEFADFLTFLLQDALDDEIIIALYDTFFLTIDSKTGTTYLRKTMNTIVVVGLFYPFYLVEAKKLKVAKHFEEFEIQSGLNIREYLAYLGKLSAKYHDNIPINQGRFVDLLVLIVKGYLTGASDFPVISGEMGIDQQNEAIRAML